ncbi:DEAD/DEAH box helicase family protein [Streptococcus pneumoniae]
MKQPTVIKTTKTIYPQIYAYTLPTLPEDIGWIKIGYTERKDVHQRIREQTHTAAFRVDHQLLWSDAAKFSQSDEWFKDKQFHAYLKKFKHVEQRPHTEWFYYNGNPEQARADFEEFKEQDFSQVKEELSYKLRVEQEEAVKATLAYQQGHPNGEFLWNAKPRFGKTLTTYDLARKMDAQNVLVVTNRPAIANSWFDDFEKFIAWQTEYKFVSTSDSLKERPVLTREEFLAQMTDNTRQIAFISLQDLKGAISFGGVYPKLEWVKKLNWDLLVIDEAHEGVDTLKADVAFNEISRRFTLHLSGTPFKAVASGKFSREQIFNWTYADEQEAKVSWSDVNQNNPYEKLPRLNLFSYQMGQMIADKVQEGAVIDGENKDYAFDLNEFFATKDTGSFVYEADVKKWLDSLSHNEKYPFSTPELRAELKHTFWLLNRVSSAKALEKILKKHPVFKDYAIVVAAGDGKTDDDQMINEKALDRVKKAIAENDKTITLSVGQLTTGITIPEWSAVLMLSNMKSPSLYMQAAFRSQNPWEYEVDGQVYQKENAYVFDFAPERTLIIYDEFANNLSPKTLNGGGTTEDRKENIRTLLNFLPVIAEDETGKMVALDVQQVLTIPKAIKAQEVVKRGFMSNLLFQNISGIFASAGAREILEQLNKADNGKLGTKQVDKTIDTKGVAVDEAGDVVIEPEIVISQNKASFGEKIYADIKETSLSLIAEEETNLGQEITKIVTQATQDSVKELAKESGISGKQAERILSQQVTAIGREVELVEKKAAIKQAEVKQELEKKVEAAREDKFAVAEAQRAYEIERQKIEEARRAELLKTVQEKTKEVTQKTTETILQQSEEKKKQTVEDDVRARLRGFSRTIPSFLMAYGVADTCLATFDQTISDTVFLEVTGISLEQFRMLRDEYQFFDETVFDESVQEFLRTKERLANYFDEEQDEDIFDYIPPQKTNQIFTPKKVVQMMIDQLEQEDPSCFTDPNKTFADLYVKSGLYLTEIVKRLYKGLEGVIPDKDERLKHILENQIYGFAPSEIIYNIAKNFIFGFDERAETIDSSHIVHLDTTPYARGESEMSFEEKCEELFGGHTHEI